MSKKWDIFSLCVCVFFFLNEKKDENWINVWHLSATARFPLMKFFESFKYSYAVKFSDEAACVREKDRGCVLNLFRVSELSMCAEVEFF